MRDFIRWLGVGADVNWWLVGGLLVGAALCLYAWSRLRNGGGK
jgi:hypothetical protein